MHRASPYVINVKDPQRGLGLSFRPARTSVQDTIDDLRRRGRLPAA